MLRMTKFLIALTTCSCAASASVDVPQPSSRPFVAIEKGRCSPELDGVFLSWTDAKHFILKRETEKSACKLQTLELERQRDQALFQTSELAKSVPDGFMAKYGVLVGVVVGFSVASLAFGTAWMVSK